MTEKTRFVILGMAEGQKLLFVVYTERGDFIRIISARKVTEREHEEYVKHNAQ